MGDKLTWCGAPLSEIYGSHSAWGAPEFPLILPAYNHAVLYHVSSSGELIDKPPSPQRGQDRWDNDCVRMPCSKHSLYPVEESEGVTNLKERWEIIETSLKSPIRNSTELANAILAYNTKFKTRWKFGALHKLFNEHLEEEETEYFFNVTLPEIAKLALSLPHLIQSPIPLLRQHKNRAVSLSQQQISCLLANAFFCTFPRRNTAKKTSEYASFPYINFNTLYEGHSAAVLEKLKCICHYFRRICTKVPVGVITFMRHSVEPKNCPVWSESTKLLGGTPLHIDCNGTIEDNGVGLIQIDFANKFLGGGVLRHGCVQEEIRFVICPELLISMLFTEVLTSTESLLIIGCERFSKYTGYGNTFQWSGDYQDNTPFDSSGRRRCAVLAIDASPFAKKYLQYKPQMITRELNKAWVGVSTCTSDSDHSRLLYPGIATGNWGCGAFGGSTELKSLLQLIACTEARRPIAYFTFGDTKLKTDFLDIYNYLSRHNITIGQLYKYIIEYSKIGVGKSQLHSFILQIHKDAEGNKRSSKNFEDGVTQQGSTSTNKNDSPDLFSQDENITMCSDKGFVDLEKGEGTLLVNLENKSEDSNQKSNIMKTSLLFEEMTNLDKENGELELGNSTANSDCNVHKTTDLEEISGCPDEDSANKQTVKVSSSNVAKKITDYFSKKTSK